MSWDQGREVIEGMLKVGALERVPASREHADVLIAQARQHLASAQMIAASDPAGGYSMVYDAARKSLSAVLENQGLRATSLRGHHQSAYEAVYSQLEPPLGHALRPFRRLKRARSSAEYPNFDEPPLTAEEVLADYIKAAEIVAVCDRVLDSMPVFVPGA